VTPDPRPLRICLVYDCLYPWTVGGAERWYRAVAEALAGAGHDVTYLTRRQWGDDDAPGIPGVRIVAVAKDEPLYGPDGNRRIGQAIRFGGGVLRHLARHRGRYDVVHTASFPYFSLLAAGAARVRDPFRLVVDWHEVWTLGYWREYLGPAAGRIGYLVQRACLRIPQRAYCFSRLHARRLRDEQVAGPVTILEGEYAGPLEPAPVRDADRLVVFAGRHIAEKRVPALVPALAAARERVPGLEGVIFGDGPERAEVLAAIERHGASDWLHAPGFVDGAEIEDAMRRALCMVLPSRREGYGMVVIEASAAATPSVVVADPDNAATEHVAEGVNGFVAPSAEPQDLADAIVRVADAGTPLRASTARWFAENAPRLSLARSLEQLLDGYADSTRR
jgi:glycosyltransferase involved in cell wall biosynthesis